MNVYLGIDLGTSSLRAILVDQAGQTRAVVGRTYPTTTPRPGRAEQSVADWWNALTGAVREALGLAGHPPVAALALTGQMHGVVLVDGAGRPVRAPIVWTDQRGARQARRLEEDFGVAWVSERAGMPPAAGIQGTLLAWLKENEPDSLRSARTALLPKDYLRLRLTGEAATDPSDASGTLLFDVLKVGWSDELIDALGVDGTLLPPVLPSAGLTGGLLPEAAAELGLPPGTPVAIGASDQATVDVSLELAESKRLALGVSSGGTVLAAAEHPEVKVGTGVHTMASARGAWLAMGAILSAGLSLEWLASVLGVRDRGSLASLVAEARTAPSGADGLIFVPYLRGERTPIFDSTITAAFRNLRYDHGRAHIVRAVLEGVGFALRDCIDATLADADEQAVVGFGGGLRNDVWRQIVADIIGRRIEMVSQDEHSAFGAAVLAAHAIDAPIIVRHALTAVTAPNERDTAVYARAYRAYSRARDELRTEDGVHRRP